jgi:signal transduction histidine kinase/DNA-binding response OmpR family regulator/ligand-binding sensor domain-containing protein
MFRFILLIFALFLQIITGDNFAFADNPVWRTIQLSNEEGLSNSAVNSIYRDQQGFMWFGTWDGLNRYDGKNIKTFYPDPFDPSSLSNNIIRNILEDRQGNLWIITERGVNKYSQDRENFQSWFTAFSELSLVEHSLKGAVGPDGNIWINAYGVGLFRFLPEINDFINVKLPQLHKSMSSKPQVFSFRGNTLYLLEDNSLYIFNINKENNPELISVSDLDTNETWDTSWFFDFDNKGWLARAFKNGGFQISSLQNTAHYTMGMGDTDLIITTLHPDVAGNFVWMGTDDGNIYQFNPGTRRINQVTDEVPQLAGKKVKIWSILETPDDLLWIGTDGEGVFRSILKPKPFFQIQSGEASQRQLNHNIVRAIYEDSSGNLWVGTRGNGLNFIPYDKGPTIYYTTQNGLTNNAVLSISEDTDGNIWIGHDGIGIDILDKATGRFYQLPRDLVGGEHLSFGSVYDICMDAYGQVWLGTSGYGVLGLKINKENGRYILKNYHHLHSNGSDSSLKSNIVYSIQEEGPNILWIATRGAGIYRLNTLTGDLQNISVATSKQSGLNDNDVLSLHMSANGILWVGSSGGLTSINTTITPYAFENYTTHSGLPNNTIHAILEDMQGNIWLSTNKGLSKKDIAQKIFINFNRADGLQSNEYTDGAANFGQLTGKFYFGGINGLDWFYPQEIIISDRMPQLILTSFRLYNKIILPGDSTLILNKNINDLEKITLKHHQNFFTIEFTTLNFINPNKTLFQYKLENFNADWISAGNQREANFTNVPFGRYRLLVKATNEDALWSEEVKALDIIIRPPIWKTWQAYIVYLLISCAIVYAIFRIQTQRLQHKQKRNLEKLQQEKEKELTQYKLEFFTNLAHEFGTPLTLIFASAASLLSTSRNQIESLQLVKTIYHNSRRMQRLVQELLEFRKIDTGREKLRPAKTELVSAIHNITEVFSHFARENELDISFEPDLHDFWVMIDMGKLEKILINLLSNAIKFTPEGGNIKITLTADQENAKIVVSDSGIGISKESLPHIFNSFYQQIPEQHKKTPGFKGIGIGLAYTKSLVELMGGSIMVKSKPGAGSTFTLMLPAVNTSEGSNDITNSQNQLVRTKLLQTITDEFIDSKSEGDASTHSKPKLWTTPKKYKILIAEDDPDLSNLLLKVLSEQYDVVLARDGTQAFDIIQKSRIDLLVSDIMMPGMDGLILCKTIKSDLLTSHIPVILLTAKTEMENRIEGLEMGADSYIPKPFHPRHLFVRIEKLLKTREQVSEYFKNNFGTPAYNHQNDFSSRDNQLLQKCIDFIEKNHADENLDADHLGSHLALSKAQLYRKVKALTGLTPHGLIKNFRLKKARQMIADGQYSISDIIFMTGFNNRTYFYRSYKEVFGETPGELNKA